MDSEQRLACNFGQYSSNSGAASHQPISTSTRTERSERAGEGGSVPLLFSLFVPFSDQAVGVGRTRRKEIGSDPVHLCFEGYTRFLYIYLKIRILNSSHLHFRLESLTSFANLTYSSRALMAASVNLTRTTLFFALFCCSLLAAVVDDGVVVADDDDSTAAAAAVAFCSSD